MIVKDIENGYCNENLYCITNLLSLKRPELLDVDELGIVTEEVKLTYTKVVTPQMTYSNNSLFYLKNSLWSIKVAIDSWVLLKT